MSHRKKPLIGHIEKVLLPKIFPIVTIPCLVVVSLLSACQPAHDKVPFHYNTCPVDRLAKGVADNYQQRSLSAARTVHMPTHGPRSIVINVVAANRKRREFCRDKLSIRIANNCVVPCSVSRSIKLIKL